MDRVKIHEEICEELTKLYADKNADYGGSFVNTRKEVDRAIVVRLMDKLERIKNITTKEARVKDESLEDSLMDLANYCIMELIEIKRDRQKDQLGEEISDLEIFINDMMQDTGKSKQEIIEVMINHLENK